ncbi:MAG: transposase [Bryobacteraceae bacterium]
MLLRHLEGILNYCHVIGQFGVVEAVNGNIKALMRRGRGYKLCFASYLAFEGSAAGIAQDRNSRSSGGVLINMGVHIPAQSPFFNLAIGSSLCQPEDQFGHRDIRSRQGTRPRHGLQLALLFSAQAHWFRIEKHAIKTLPEC